MADILIVEDEGLIAQDMRQRLAKLGHAVCGLAASGEEAIHQADTRRPALIFMDIALQGTMDGIEAARQIRMLWRTPIIYVTSCTDHETLRRARLTRPSDYLQKPFDDQQLLGAVERALSTAGPAVGEARP